MKSLTFLYLHTQPGTVTAQFIYDNKDVVVGGVGSDYAELIAKCSPDERWYAFVRIETGDELSKR
jgi:hypothetical protein